MTNSFNSGDGFSDKAKDVAQFFGVSTQQVYRLTRERRLPADTYVYLNERTVRYSIPRLQRWAEGERKAA